MRFERLEHLGNDWYIQIGDDSKAFSFILRWFSGYGFRVIINFYSDILIKIFKRNQCAFGV